MSEIVIGLDLSRSARAALDWAAEQARATGRTLRAVNVISASATYSMALGGVAVPIAPSNGRSCPGWTSRTTRSRRMGAWRPGRAHGS